MLTQFFPAHCVSAYQASPYRARIDLIGQRLIEQKYLPIVVAQHVREIHCRTPRPSEDGDVQRRVMTRTYHSRIIIMEP